MSDSELTVERSRLSQSLGPAGGQVLVEVKHTVTSRHTYVIMTNDASVAAGTAV